MKFDVIPRFLLLLFFLSSCSGEPEKRATPYIILRPSNWEYMNLYGSEKNVSGFSDDLLYEIAKEEKVSFSVLSLDQPLLYRFVNTNNIDGVLTALPPNEDNQRNYTFSDPYFLTGPVLIVRSASRFKSLKDLTGREIGFENSYFWALRLKDTSDTIFRPYKDLTSALNDLIDAHIDAVVIDSIEAFRLVSGPYRKTLRVATPTLIPMAIRLVVKKGKSEELITLFNHGLSEMKKSGLYAKILRYWQLFDTSTPTSAYTDSPPSF